MIGGPRWSTYFQRSGFRALPTSGGGAAQRTRGAAAPVRGRAGLRQAAGAPPQLASRRPVPAAASAADEMDPGVEVTVEKIHSTAAKAVLLVTGGASQVRQCCLPLLLCM